MATLNLTWCSHCKLWLPAGIVRAGVCRTCKRAYERYRFATDPVYRAERRRHAMMRKRGVEPVPEIGREVLLEDFDGQCAYCCGQADTWDHIVPVIQGGKTVPGNIVPSCRSCNSSKKDRSLEDFLASRKETHHDALIDILALSAV